MAAIPAAASGSPTTTTQPRLNDSQPASPNTLVQANMENMVHALAGAGGGIISMAVTYPLITVGTRMQIQKSKNNHDKGFMDVMQSILDKEGVAGLYSCVHFASMNIASLYSGLNSALFGIALTNGVYYYWYEAARGALDTWTAKQGPIGGLLAGAMAGTIQGSIQGSL